MRRNLLVSAILASVVLATSCVCSPASGPRTAVSSTRATATPARALASATPEWSTYKGKGVTVRVPSDDIVLPLSSDKWLYFGMVTNAGKDLVYRLYVNNLGTQYGSSIPELKRRRSPDPNSLVLSEGEGRVGEREFYRLVAVPIPPDPEKDTTNVYYYFYQGKELVVVLFECFSCGKVEGYFSYWESILARIELN